MHTYAAEDFPRLPEVETIPTHSVDRAALLDTVSRVSRSASRDESRPVLTGILVRFESDALVMAATDSYRLAVKETALEGGGLELEAIVPARRLVNSRGSPRRATRSSSARTRTRSRSTPATRG